MLSRAHAHSQRGFTLVEVLVAIFILLVGVLGVVSLVDGANAVTSKTKAREGGTNIARSIIEVARGVRYRDLTAASLLAALNARPGLQDVTTSDAGYTVKSRGVKYELTTTVCSLDDDKDNLGLHPTGITFCPDSQVGATLGDRNPDDYKRVRVTLVWNTRNTTQSITQTSSIINPVGGLGPSVIGLTTTSGSSTNPVRIESLISSANFVAVTSTSAADLTWNIDGDVQESKPSGGPINWSFTWDFVAPNGDILYHDCTYAVGAEAFDEQGRAGSPYSVTVIVNRIVGGLAVENFAGGRNGNGNTVDVQWAPTPECDIVGYRVYRDDDPAFGSPSAVTCTGQGSATYVENTVTDCVDESAPGGTMYYRVRPLDTNASGTLREGAWSTSVTAGGSNSVPSVPQNLAYCIGGQVDCFGPDGEPAPSGVLVLRWDASTDSDGNVQFYRIYRDGTSYAARHDVFYPNPGIAWFEPDSDGQTHTYRVSAVDDKFGESGLSAPLDAG